jgi:signal transduction histidine kinase
MDARRARLVDVALAVVASGSALAAMLARLEPEAREPDALAYALILALGAPMLVRRQRPRLVLAVTVGVLVVYYALGYSAVGFAVPLAPALFSVAEAGRWRSGALTGLFVLTVATWWRLYDENEDRVIVGYDLATTLAVMAAVLAWGDAVRSRREWQRELAQRMAAATLEREREAERRVAAERLRIARDVHDVMGHTVAVISIQADVAREALDDDLPTARGAIDTIRHTSRQALNDLRAVMGLLRGDPSEPETAEPHATGPAPGLGQLARLVSAARTEKLRADFRVEGEPFPLPSPVDTTAHRVVQEALTNVIRHADASVVDVVVRYLERSVEIEITDDGRGAPPTTDGFGLHGMHQRVHLLGGEITAANRRDGGFAVRAVLPVPQEALVRGAGR